jgi:hypothetical protein
MDIEVNTINSIWVFLISGFIGFFVYYLFCDDTPILWSKYKIPF